MRSTPSLTTVVNLAFIACWPIAVGIAYAASRRGGAARRWWDHMAAQWRPSLVIALLYPLGALAVQRNIGNSLGYALEGLALFCQGLFGFALARGIAKFEPLPVVEAIRQRRHAWRQIALMLLIALLVVPATFIVSAGGALISQGIFHERYIQTSGASLFPYNKWASFFLLLAGAGIAEETLFRLVILSLVWRLSGSRWLAILISAAAFGAYHLTPIDGFYLTFWQYPLRQFFSSMLVGIVLGYVYVRRGYETAVLGHTFADWIPLLLMT